MIDVCGCGCGAVIDRHHPDPFFRYPQCQRLWLWSLHLPEGERVTRRAEMRFFHELWVCEPWASQMDFYDHVSLPALRQVANGVLQDIDVDLRLFTSDEVEDYMRVLVYRWWRMRSEFGYLRAWDLVPEWVLIERDTSDYWRKFLETRAATLAVSG